MKQQTVHINGVAYDSITGLRITPRRTIERNQSHAHVVHAKTQRSKTLNRKLVRKTATAVKSPVTSPHTIRKFADIQPVKRSTIHSKATTADIKPQVHPVVAKAHAKHAARTKAAQPKSTTPTAATLTSQQIKQHVVSDSLKKAPSHHGHHTHHPKKKVPSSQEKPRQFGRMLSVGSASLALLLLAGYFTYLNMPNLSVRVAAAQAGVEASYPAYHPDGYSLDGRIAYNTGSVSMKFAANAGPSDFTLVQSSTDWDSTALEQNYVEEKWGDAASATIDNGLTIYSSGGEAAWVNGGILYTIQGNAPLSTKQLTHIATSM